MLGHAYSAPLPVHGSQCTAPSARRTTQAAASRVLQAGWLLEAMILALLAHAQRSGRRLMVLLHLQTGNDRDSSVDVRLIR